MVKPKNINFLFSAFTPIYQQPYSKQNKTNQIKFFYNPKFIKKKRKLSIQFSFFLIIPKEPTTELKSKQQKNQLSHQPNTNLNKNLKV